ncbi:MAG: hypothetical protein K0U39_10180 [Alphaproteobacteria bacterium]|nr:hypothetical protein [Alphaproteobacteria bacterium]
MPYLFQAIRNICCKLFFAMNKLSPLTFMVVFAWVILIDIIERNGHLINREDMFFMVLYSTIILVLQYITLKKIERRIKNINLFNGCVALFFVLNFLYFYILNNVDYLALSYFKSSLILLGIGLFIYLLIKYSERWVLSLFLCLSIMSCISKITTGSTRIIDKFIIPDEHPLPENYLAQNFVKTPNIYLLSFDAMISQNAARLLLRLDDDESPAFIDALKEVGVSFIPNAFSDTKTSSGAFSTLAALDLKWYRDLYGDHENYGTELVSGSQWGPLYDIFKKNGYQIQIVASELFRSKLKVRDRGVEHIFHKGDGFCRHIHNKNAFWNYCGVKDIWFNTFVPRDADLYEKRIELAAKSDNPYFTIVYTYSPGHKRRHINVAYDEQELLAYKKRYLSSSQQTAEYIRNYIKIIRQYDSEGIILFNADHSAFIASNANEKKIRKNSPFSQRELKIDNHGILMATLDPHGCKIAEPIVTTSIDMIYNLLTCLTGGQPVLRERYNSEPDFIDYLYDPVPAK